MSKFNYRPANGEPASLAKMGAMMVAKAAPKINDPTTVATQAAYRIYMDAKSAILLCDGDRAKVRVILDTHRARVLKEVLIEQVRNKSVEYFDRMLAALPE